MQTKFTFTFLFILSVFSLVKLQASPYQTVHKNGVTYFSNAYGRVSCIRIASVKLETDSVFYPFTTMQHVSEECYSPSKASWIGPKVVMQQNGDNLFFNKYGDTICIRTTAQKGDSWVVTELQDSVKVEGIVLQLDTVHFLGLVDSVKTIGFKVTDKDGSLLDFDLNHMQVQISKTHGFVKALNFYKFPIDEYDYLYGEEFGERILCGLSEPKIGLQNLTWMEVYDFQVGDELHISMYDSEQYWPGSYQKFEKTIYKYIERNELKDGGVYYKYLLTKSIEKQYSAEPELNSFQFSLDTLTERFYPDSLFDKLPGEPVIEDKASYNTYSMHVSSSDSKTKNLDFFGKYSDTCWHEISWHGCFTWDVYRKGLGGPYYYCSDFWSTERKLVYYKKGETTWGDPLEINAVAPVYEENTIQVYPNPTQGRLTIHVLSVQHPVMLEVRNLLGQVVLTQSLLNEHTELSVEHLARGTYFYRALIGQQTVGVGKFVRR